MSRVLLIDAGPYAGEVTGMLEQSGYQVQAVRSAQAGLATLSEQQPDVVLCNATLPESVGFEVVDLLKEALPFVPVMLICDRSGLGSISDGIVQAEEMITSPIDPRELRLRIRSLLRLKESMDTAQRLNQTLEERVESETKMVLELSDRLLEVREDERMEIAEELHHDLGQRIIVLKWLIQKVSGKLPGDADMQRLPELVDQISDLVRSISHRISPVDLPALGIGKAIENLMDEVRQSGIVIQSDLGDLDGQLNQSSSILLYRVFQEVFLNAIRHSQASAMTVQAWAGPQRLRISIKDNGKGIPADAKRGLGLFLIRRKMELIRGKFKLLSGADGTELILEIPISA